MVKKTIEHALMTSVLMLLLLLMSTTESRAGGIVNVHIYLVAGSIWDSPQGKQFILEDKIQAVGIWRSIGVDLKVLPGVKLLKGDPNKVLTEADLKNYAGKDNLNATARNIVVVYTNKTYKGGRAYASPILEKADTPVIVIVEEAFNDPPTNGYPRRDFAHELGHILIRSDDHVYHQKGMPKADAIFGDGPANLNLMNQAKNLGTELTDENQLYQKKKALQYPCGPGITNCPEITMAPGARSTAVIKEVNQVGSQPSPTNPQPSPANLRHFTPQMLSATMKPYYWSQPSLPSLGSFTASRAQSQKQGIDTDISFVCSRGPVASYDEYATVKVLIGDQPIRSRLEYVPIGAQPLKVATQPPPGDRGSWIVKEIKFQDVYGNGQWQTFTPNAPEANVSLNISERRGTALSQLKITVDQCGGPSGVTGANVVRSCTGNEIEAKRGMVLCEGDKFRTGSNSRAALDFLSPNRNVFATVTLSEASEVEIGGLDTGDVTGAVLAFEAGEVQSGVNNVFGVPVQFTVISPTVAVSAKGTVFTVRHDRQRQVSTVDVKEGEVEVTPTNPTLQAFTLRAGQQAQVAQNNVGPMTPGTAGGGNRAGAQPGTSTGPTVTVGRPPSAGIGGAWSAPTGDIIELVQNGNRITGRYRGILGTGEITGTFDGKNLSATVRPNQALLPLAIPLTLTLMEDGRLFGRLETPLATGTLVFSRTGR